MARPSVRACVGCAVVALGLAGVGPATPAGGASSVSSVSSVGVSLGTSRPTAGSGGVGDPYFPRYGNGGYDARNYRLSIRYDPATDRLRGAATMTADARKALSSFHLDLVGLKVHQVVVDGRPATWTRKGGHELVIEPAQAIPDGSRFRTTVRYAGEPGFIDSPSLGRYGFQPTPDGALAVGEPEAAAFWFPVNDHPSDKARYRIDLTVPRGLQAVSNGLPTRRTRDGSWVTTRWVTRDPMASYLVFAAIGHFDVHRWRTRSGLPVIDAVDSGITGPMRRRIDQSLGRQGKILAHLERWFGPYPFEAAGGVVDDLDLGFALETQTRPVYSKDIWWFQGGDDVVVHELAHEWYGDAVSLHRWRDIWLNEGFASYAEWLWQRPARGVTPQQVFRENYDGIPADAAFWDLKIGDPGRKALFDDAVYLRGAMTLQALRDEIGTRDFFQVLRQWVRSHRYGNGRTAGFIRLAERVSGQELSPLFQAWLYTGRKPPSPEGSPAAASGRQRAEAQVPGTAPRHRGRCTRSLWAAGLVSSAMEENKARRIVDILRDRGTDADLARVGVYQFGVNVRLADGRVATWDSDGTAALEAQVMRNGVLVGFVPSIAGSEEFSEDQVIDAILRTDYDKPIATQRRSSPPPAPALPRRGGLFRRFMDGFRYH